MSRFLNLADAAPVRHTLFPGWPGIVVGGVVFPVIWIIVALFTPKFEAFSFENNPGDFAELMKAYLDVAKFVLTLAAGGIVLIISSTSLGTAQRLPTAYAAPLFILAMCILYGIIFMPALILGYEAWKAHRMSYIRAKYIRNQTLGFASLMCFCLGYAWLIVAATQN